MNQEIPPINVLLNEHRRTNFCRGQAFSAAVVRLAFALVLASAACVGAAASAAPRAKSTTVTVERSPLQSSSWYGTWNDAAKKTMATKRPLLAVIVQPGCVDCAAFYEILRKPENKDAFSGAVRLRVDVLESPESMKLAQDVGGKWTPTVILYRPNDAGALDEDMRLLPPLKQKQIDKLNRRIEELAPPATPSPTLRTKSRRSTK